MKKFRRGQPRSMRTYVTMPSGTGWASWPPSAPLRESDVFIPESARRKERWARCEDQCGAERSRKSDTVSVDSCFSASAEVRSAGPSPPEHLLDCLRSAPIEEWRIERSRCRLNDLHTRAPGLSGSLAPGVSRWLPGVPGASIISARGRAVWTAEAVGWGEESRGEALRDRLANR
eukprot:scaffold224891_cov36-Tisochrysis_lutea.AAC.8